MEEMQETQIWFLGWEDPWKRAWQPTPVFLPGESHGQKSPAGYSPWGRKELDTTEETEHAHIYVYVYMEKIFPREEKLIS